MVQRSGAVGKNRPLYGSPVAWPFNDSENRGDLVLIQVSEFPVSTLLGTYKVKQALLAVFINTDHPAFGV